MSDEYPLPAGWDPKDIGRFIHLQYRAIAEAQKERDLAKAETKEAARQAAQAIQERRLAERKRDAILRQVRKMRAGE